MAQIKYIPPMNEGQKNFIEPTPEPYFIEWLFGHLCVMCKHPADHINEIVPKSRTKYAIADWTNRVPLCRKCHMDVFHREGVTDKKIEEMRDARKSFLRTMGREEYLDLPIIPPNIEFGVYS